MFSDFLNKIKIFRFFGFVFFQSSFPSVSRRDFKFNAGRFKFTCLFRSIRNIREWTVYVKLAMPSRDDSKNP